MHGTTLCNHAQDECRRISVSSTINPHVRIDSLMLRVWCIRDDAMLEVQRAAQRCVPLAAAGIERIFYDDGTARSVEFDDDVDMRVIVREEAVKSSNSPSKAALSYYLSAHLQTCKERRETEAVQSNRERDCRIARCHWRFRASAPHEARIEGRLDLRSRLPPAGIRTSQCGPTCGERDDRHRRPSASACLPAAAVVG